MSWQISFQCKRSGDRSSATYHSIDEAKQYASQTASEIVGWKLVDA